MLSLGIRNHVVILASMGHAFCIVPVQERIFPAKAARWDVECGRA